MRSIRMFIRQSVKGNMVLVFATIILIAGGVMSPALAQKFPGDGYPNPDAFGVSGHGPALRYKDNGNGTFTDKNTGFVWEIKTNVAGSVHNVNNTYTWSSTGSDPDGTLFTVFLDTLNNTCRDDETVECDSDADCSGVGGPCGFAGHRDWCIPNIKQLQSIVDYSTCNGCNGGTAATSVPGLTAASLYWSATTNANFANLAWVIDFFLGLVGNDNKDFLNPARAVRPCP